ncbi:MAG: hypothetical protein K0Q49_2337 [Haloplasmataceae bacterium]|nr:hypothetical protein [Haloplasmataceae bacterium]
MVALVTNGGEWFKSGWFEHLEKLGSLKENGNAFLGIMRYLNDGFEYWIGMFFPKETKVPEGFMYTDIPEGDIATCFIYGREDNGELFGMDVHNTCMEKISMLGWKLQDDPWFFER